MNKRGEVTYKDQFKPWEDMMLVTGAEPVRVSIFNLANQLNTQILYIMGDLT